MCKKIFSDTSFQLTFSPCPLVVVTLGYMAFGEVCIVVYFSIFFFFNKRIEIGK